jgi:hypothetical protein
MYVQIISQTAGRRARIASKTLGKVLHLACFHDWHPERLSSNPPSASWNTEVIMPYVSPYLSGSVSQTDASSLAVALKRVLTSEGSGLSSEVYLAVLGLIAVAASGPFELELEEPASGKGKKVAEARR